MSLDELIEAAAGLREETGGDAPVLMVTARGYAQVALTDGLGFEREDGTNPQPVVLVVPVRD